MKSHKRNPLELPVEEAPKEIRRQRGVEEMTDETDGEEGRVVQISGTSEGKSKDQQKVETEEASDGQE